MYSISKFSHWNNHNLGRYLEEGRESQNPQTETVNYNKQILSACYNLIHTAIKKCLKMKQRKAWCLSIVFTKGSQ